MIDGGPLGTETVFTMGAVAFTSATVVTWLLIVVIVLVCWLGLRGASARGRGFQTVFEIIVGTMAKQIEEIIRRDPWPYLPLLGTLFLFIVISNLLTVVPGLSAPTGNVETPAALAVIVFFSAHYYGVRSMGIRRYLQRYTKPSLLLLPLNVLSEFTRTFSLMVRLFGNIMSHEFMIAIIVFLAGLLLPVPFMLLGVLIGIVQAYIFTVLAAVFIGAAVSFSEGEGGSKNEH